jgi:glycerol uptake facilitator-like aquaporin
MRLSRCLAAEALGTALLLAVIVGSGIMGERLAGGNVAVALLANSIATGCGLWVLISILGPISGAHLNPAVTLAMASAGHLPWQHVLPYVVVQVAAAFLGVALAHVMFSLPAFAASEHVRSGAGQWVSEAVATTGLLLTIGLTRHRGAITVGGLVAAYITAAYWFTASTSFANPAVTLARAATNTFAGIRPIDAAGFIVVQLMVAPVALRAANWLVRKGPFKARQRERTLSGGEF